MIAFVGPRERPRPDWDGQLCQSTTVRIPGDIETGQKRDYAGSFFARWTCDDSDEGENTGRRRCVIAPCDIERRAAEEEADWTEGQKRKRRFGKQ